MGLLKSSKKVPRNFGVSANMPKSESSWMLFHQLWKNNSFLPSACFIFLSKSQRSCRFFKSCVNTKKGINSPKEKKSASQVRDNELSRILFLPITFVKSSKLPLQSQICISRWCTLLTAALTIQTPIRNDTNKKAGSQEIRKSKKDQF